MSDKYVVYFDADTNNCSGWLDMSNHDVFCFCHAMCAADVFDSEEDAKKNAEEYLKRLFDAIDRIPEKESRNPAERYTKEDKEKDKGHYRYWILKIDEKMADEIKAKREEGKKESERMMKEFTEKLRKYDGPEFVSF